MYHQLDDIGDFIVQCECGASTCPHGTRYTQEEAASDWNDRGVKTDEYLIYSRKHSKPDTAVWWKANACGYTTNIHQAGVYSHDAAKQNVGSRGDSVAIKASEAFKLLTVVTTQYVERLLKEK